MIFTSGLQSYVISYDIMEPKRLVKVHKTMMGYGQPLHYSVFRCDLNSNQDHLRCPRRPGKVKEISIIKAITYGSFVIDNGLDQIFLSVQLLEGEYAARMDHNLHLSNRRPLFFLGTNSFSEKGKSVQRDPGESRQVI